MTTARQRKAREATQRELAEWRALQKAAEAKCDAITDLDELTDALRELLLARANHLEAYYGRSGREEVALTRRRANSESYRRTLALFTLAKRLKDEADKELGHTAEELASLAARHAEDQARLSAFYESITARLGH